MKKLNGFLLLVLLAITAGCNRTDSKQTLVPHPKPDTTKTPNTGPMATLCAVTPEKVFLGGTEVQIDKVILTDYFQIGGNYYTLDLYSTDIYGDADTALHVSWGRNTQGSAKYKIVSQHDFYSNQENKAFVTFNVGFNPSRANYFKASSVSGGSDSLTVILTDSMFHICTVTDSTQLDVSTGPPYINKAPVMLDRTVKK